MISYVKGRLVDIFGDTIVVEAGSLGFNIRVPLSLLDTLPDIGREVLIYTYFQVKEDAMTLYGFSSRQDLDMFKIDVYKRQSAESRTVKNGLTSEKDTSSQKLRRRRMTGNMNRRTSDRRMVRIIKLFFIGQV